MYIFRHFLHFPFFHHIFYWITFILCIPEVYWIDFYEVDTITRIYIYISYNLILYCCVRAYDGGLGCGKSIMRLCFIIFETLFLFCRWNVFHWKESKEKAHSANKKNIAYIQHISYVNLFSSFYTSLYVEFIVCYSQICQQIKEFVSPLLIQKLYIKHTKFPIYPVNIQICFLKFNILLLRQMLIMQNIKRQKFLIKFSYAMNKIHNISYTNDFPIYFHTI